jgi:hypothetical protein
MQWKWLYFLKTSLQRAKTDGYHCMSYGLVDHSNFPGLGLLGVAPMSTSSNPIVIPNLPTPQRKESW